MLKYSEREVWSGQNKAEMASVSTRECVEEGRPTAPCWSYTQLKGLGRGVTRVSHVYTGWWQSKAVGMLHNARPGSLAKKLDASAAPTSRGQGDGPHLATALAQGLWRKQAER